MYSKNIDSYKDHLRNYAYEDFLLAQGIETPSELHGIIDKFDVSKVIYFLKNICVESVMDVSVSFSSSKELLKERLAVCQLLLKIDKENTSSHQEEIKNISRELAIKDRMREIEKSKIYVDVDSVTEVASKSLKENFARYMSFIKGGISEKDIKVRSTAREKLGQGDVTGLLNLVLPENEINAILESMVSEFRDQFVSSTQHGLDGYLSTRIRHGTLSGHIRRPLEANSNLITNKYSDKGEYKKNEYWIARIGLTDKKQTDRLSKAFAEFSKEFDDLIKKIISEWIQVKKSQNDKGLIDFSLRKYNFVYLSSLVTVETTFEQFLDQLFAHFFDILDASLVSIRNGLNLEIKPEVNRLLTDLQKDIESICSDYDITELNNTISRARTDLQNSLDRVIEWFRLSRSTKDEPFGVEEAINISLASLEASGYSITTQVDISEEMDNFKIQGKLPSFVDILFIILENVARHSAISDTPEANIKVKFDDNILLFRVENEVAASAITAEQRNKLSGIRKALQEKRFLASVTKEGGTGFYKIQKTLSHDFRPLKSDFNPKLDFDFFGDNQFFVEVGIPIHSIVSVSEN